TRRQNSKDMSNGILNCDYAALGVFLQPDWGLSGRAGRCLVLGTDPGGSGRPGVSAVSASSASDAQAGTQAHGGGCFSARHHVLLLLSVLPVPVGTGSAAVHHFYPHLCHPHL